MIVLVGAGAWGQNLLRNLSEMGVLHAVVDPAETARELARDVAVPCFNTVDDILSDDAVKGVVIATPAPTHKEIVLAAIAAGKDVYVEKPISLTLEDALAMAQAAREANRILMVGHLLQYHPVFRSLRYLARSGQLGEISFVSSSRLNFGRIRSNENVIWSFSPHDISMVLSLIDAEVKQVSARSHEILQQGIADIGHVDLYFSNGARAEVRSSWLHPFKEQSLVVIGSKAMAVFNDREPWERKLAVYEHRVSERGGTPVAEPGEVRYIDVEKGEPLRLELQHFIDCIETRETPITDAREAIAVLKVLQHT